MPRSSETLTALFAALCMAGPASAQGWIEPVPEPGVGTRVERVGSEVTVHVTGLVAAVEVTEWFVNRGQRLAEGHYLYPLPGEAAFDGFSLFQGDRELRGEIMDAATARSIYEEIVRRRADPALIELAGEGLLRARVFPIAPGETRKVTLRYTQVLNRAGRSLQFLYAGSVAAPSVPAPVDGRGPWVHPARNVPPPAAPEATFRMVVDDGARFLDPFSPTHTLVVDRAGGSLAVEVDGVLAGRLSVFLPLAGQDVGLSVATHRPVGDDGYVMLTLSPGRGVDEAAVQPRDVTVVLDVSGSMSGEKIGQAKAALRGILGTLALRDRFRLVAFSNAVRMDSEAWRPATEAARADARAWVDALVADGGTNIGAALDEAFRVAPGPERLPVVIFLTDGLPSVGEESPERLADRAEAALGRARIFAFGVGHDVNTHLLDRLGQAGRGSTDYVEPGENVERAVGLVTAKIRYPVLTDVTVAGAPVRFEEIHPVRIPDVFAGQELVLFGRYRGEGSGTVVLRGMRSGRSRDFAVEADFPRATAANAWMPRLWASRKLGHLMRQVWTEGETPSLVEEIRTLALRYGLPSRYTSYLVEEPEAVVLRARPGPAVPAARPWAVQASGAGAVRQAQEAARFRNAASMDELQAMEAEAASDLAPGGDASSRRMLAGRLFELREGVWTDTATPSGATVDIRLYSPAYFRVLEALPELRPVVRGAERVRVSGRQVDLHLGDAGMDEITDEGLRQLVRRFRGASGPPAGGGA